MYKEAIALRHNTVIVAQLFKDPSQPLLFQMPPKLLILYNEAEGNANEEPWRTDVFSALCDSLVEKSHT